MGLVTRVVHCKREPYDVYIGRPSKWGNLYTHQPSVKAKHPELILVSTRDEAVASYLDWLEGQDDDFLASIGDLKGSTLGCWCHPRACHGDILAELADAL